MTEKEKIFIRFPTAKVTVKNYADRETLLKQTIANLGETGDVETNGLTVEVFYRLDVTNYVPETFKGEVRVEYLKVLKNKLWEEQIKPMLERVYGEKK